MVGAPPPLGAGAAADRPLPEPQTTMPPTATSAAGGSTAVAPPPLSAPPAAAPPSVLAIASDEQALQAVDAAGQIPLVTSAAVLLILCAGACAYKLWRITIGHRLRLALRADDSKHKHKLVLHDILSVGVTPSAADPGLDEAMSRDDETI